MEKEKKGQKTADAAIALGLPVLFCLACRLWPVLLAIAAAVSVITAWRLLCLGRKQEEDAGDDAPMERERPAPDIRELERSAYVLIQEKITCLADEAFPGSAWVWETAMPMQEIMAGGEVHILLNRAGGYRRAEVIYTGLTVRELRFGKEICGNSPEREPQGPDVEEDVPAEDDRSLLAFQWTEAHMQELDGRCNEAIGRGESEMLIPLEELPDPESWEDICSELDRNGIKKAKPVTDGILLLLS